MFSFHPFGRGSTRIVRGDVKKWVFTLNPGNSGFAEILNTEYVDKTGYIHETGEAYLTDTNLNLPRYCQCDITVHGADHFRDGDVFRLKSNPDCSLRVIHTPGHTPDSVIFYDQLNDTAFVGDTIFKGSRGNDQYPGGNGVQLIKSIRQRILSLPDQTVLLSGHSDETKVGAEKRYY